MQKNQRSTSRSNKLKVAALLCVGFACLSVHGRSHADAPLGRYAISTDTVLDNFTRLTWQRVVPGQTYVRSAAVSYCTSLSLSGTGWRLPTVMELQSIVDDTRWNPAIDPTAFPNTPAEFFWTSSIPGSGSGWYVRFSKGDSGGQMQSVASRVRCVR